MQTAVAVGRSSQHCRATTHRGAVGHVSSLHAPTTRLVRAPGQKIPRVGRRKRPLPDHLATRAAHSKPSARIECVGSDLAHIQRRVAVLVELQVRRLPAVVAHAHLELARRRDLDLIPVRALAAHEHAGHVPLGNLEPKATRLGAFFLLGRALVRFDERRQLSARDADPVGSGVAAALHRQVVLRREEARRVGAAVRVREAPRVPRVGGGRRGAGRQRRQGQGGSHGFF